MTLSKVAESYWDWSRNHFGVETAKDLFMDHVGVETEKTQRQQLTNPETMLKSELNRIKPYCGTFCYFFKISSICRRRDDTRFFECAFGVDETLGAK